jgi:hypothetical protein
MMAHTIMFFWETQQQNPVLDLEISATIRYTDKRRCIMGFGFSGSPDDCKKWIVYILCYAIGPVALEDLSDVGMMDESADLFTFRDALDELVTNGNIIVDENGWYEISHQSKESALQLANELPASLKAAAQEKIRGIRLRAQRNKQIVGSWDETDHSVTLTWLDKSHPDLFHLHLAVGSQEEAAIMIRNWNANAEDIYLSLMDALTKDK